MNLEKLNHSISIFANLGVLAGIIFLGIEIQQNTTMSRAQTRDAMTERQIAYLDRIIDNAEVESLFRNVEDTSDVDRTSIEFRQFVNITLTQFRMWENELYQYRQGLFDSQEFESRQRLWATSLRSSSLTGQARREVWGFQKQSFSPDFIEIVENLIQGN